MLPLESIGSEQVLYILHCYYNVASFMGPGRNCYSFIIIAFICSFIQSIVILIFTYFVLHLNFEKISAVNERMNK
jgi:predicted membrane protein